MTNTQPQPGLVRLLSDDPRDGSSEHPDTLDRLRFARDAVKMLEALRQQSASSVAALVGDWGSGKTSVVEMICSNLPSYWHYGTFTPWAYSSSADLPIGFLSELMVALRQSDKIKRVRKQFGRLAQEISPYIALIPGGGNAAATAASAVGSQLIGDASVSTAKRKAEKTLREVNEPVLMIVEDLDRLLPDELLEVFKLIRLIGRLPNVYYLLCYDETTLIDVLKATPIANGEELRAHSYLDKIVQLRLDIPPLRESQRAELLYSGLNQIFTAAKVELGLAEQKRLERIYFSALDNSLQTPRAINHFLGQVYSSYPALAKEVDFVDYFLITWLRTCEPELYQMLHTERSALLGLGPREWNYPSHKSDLTRLKQEYWASRIDTLGISTQRRLEIERVLTSLFPEAGFNDEISYSFGGSSSSRSVRNRDYFDRYFSSGVPNDEMRDEAIVEALDALQSDPCSNICSDFIHFLRSDTARMVRKIDKLREHNHPIPERELFAIAVETASQMSPIPQHLIGGDHHALCRLLIGVLTALNPEVGSELIQSSTFNEYSLEVVVDAVRRIQVDQSSAHDPLVPTDVDLAPIINAATRHLAAWFSNQVLNSFDQVNLGLFWTWHLFDVSAANTWLRAQVDKSRWTLVEAMGFLTSTTVIVGDDSGHRYLGDFALSMALEVFSENRLANELKERAQIADSFGVPHSHVRATRDSRMHAALLALKTHFSSI